MLPLLNNEFRLVIFLSLGLFLFGQNFTSSVLAQESFAVAQTVAIIDTKVENGDIVSGTDQGNILSKTAYDPGIIGVVTTTPGIFISLNNLPNSFSVVSSGYGYVRVSTSNGAIKKGDLITSSATPGVGMKATQTGFVLGSALEDYSDSSSGTIQVALNLRFAIAPQSNDAVVKSLRDMVSLSTIAALERPQDIFKYVLAGFIALLSIIISIVTFGRNGALGIEALGRNPRASQTITLGIIINTLTSLCILASGLGAAYFVLRF